MARVSNKGLALIKEFEGLYLKSYKDAVGVWTIGYGITSSDRAITGYSITKGMTITKETAEKWLEESLHQKYLPLVMKYDSKYNWNSSEIDALVSFAFNIGNIDGLTANGTRTRAQIREKILQYNKAGGRVLNGLTRRRKAELALFNEGKKCYDGNAPELPKRGYFQLADKGSNVADLEKLYQFHDLYDGEIDRIYGPAMEKATKEVQRVIGTKENGKAGSKVIPYLLNLKR